MAETFRVPAAQTDMPLFGARSHNFGAATGWGGLERFVWNFQASKLWPQHL